MKCEAFNCERDYRWKTGYHDAWHQVHYVFLCEEHFSEFNRIQRTGNWWYAPNVVLHGSTLEKERQANRRELLLILGGVVVATLIVLA